MQRGAYIRQSSRGNFADCKFISNTCGIECELSSDITLDATDTFTSNVQSVRFNSGGVIASPWNAAVSPQMIKRYIGTQVTDATYTGTTDVHNFITAGYEIFDGHEFASEGYLKVRMFGAITGTNDTKTLRIRLDSTTVMALVFAAAAAGDFVAEMVMHNWGTATQKAYGFGTTSNGHAEAISTDYTMAINTGAAVTLYVQGVLANASDQVVVEGIEIWRGEG